MLLVLLASGALTFAQAIKKPLVSAITDKDLRTDMYQMAGDHFNGREAGTLDELKVSMWLANKPKKPEWLQLEMMGLIFSFLICTDIRLRQIQNLK